MSEHTNGGSQHTSYPTRLDALEARADRADARFADVMAKLDEQEAGHHAIMRKLDKIEAGIRALIVQGSKTTT